MLYSALVDLVTDYFQVSELLQMGVYLSPSYLRRRLKHQPWSPESDEDILITHILIHGVPLYYLHYVEAPLSQFSRIFIGLRLFQSPPKTWFKLFQSYPGVTGYLLEIVYYVFSFQRVLDPSRACRLMEPSIIKLLKSGTLEELILYQGEFLYYINAYLNALNSSRPLEYARRHRLSDLLAILDYTPDDTMSKLVRGFFSGVATWVGLRVGTLLGS